MFTSGKTKDQIEQALICDIQSISKWLRINNLVLNFKKGKTECVMFGTSQKLSKVNDIGPLNITVNGSKINESATYKYLGVTLDKNFTFSEHLSSTFRKASARVKLLRRIRHFISPLTPEKNYKSLILPILLYCSNTLIGASMTN